MRLSRSTFVLLALPAASLAASLSDFTPRVSGLASNCQTVYSASISGCGSSDFTSGSCSLACIKGLQAMTVFVQAACNNVPSGANIINVFLSGQGPANLCPNANAVLSSLSATTALATTSSQAFGGWPALTTSSSASLTTSSTSSATPTTTTTASNNSSTSSATPTSTASVTESSPASTAQNTATSSATSNNPSSTKSAPASQYTDPSGGGSPFDTPGNLASAASSVSLRLGSVCITAVMVALSALR